MGAGKPVSDATFTVSPGNSVAIVITGGDYLLTGSNVDLGDPTVEYDSSLGGLQEWED